MRINKPQLFNGQYLASNDAILTALFGAGQFTANAEVFAPAEGAKILSSLIDWSVIDGSTIKIDNTSDKSIKAYIDSVVDTLTSGDISGLRNDLNIVSGDLDTLEANVAKIGLAKKDAAVEGYAATYTFTNAEGTTTEINIPKDQFLKDAAYIPSAEALRFTFELSENGVDTDKVVDIPVGELVDEYSAGNGIDISDVVDGKNVVSVKIDTAASEAFLSVDAAGLKLTGVQNAINAASGFALAEAKDYTDIASGELKNDIDFVSGQVDVVSGQIKSLNDNIASEVVAGESLPTNNAVINYVTSYVGSHNAVYTTADFSDPADVTLTGLYVDAEGQTKFWDGEKFVQTSEEVADSITETSVASAVVTVSAVSAFVEGKVAETVETVNTKAVEMVEAEASFGKDTVAAVPGRVIAVYDAAGDQCYPSIKYAAGESQLTSDGAVETFTVIYAKRIGKTNGDLSA
jgi:hypothetical protein